MNVIKDVFFARSNISGTVDDNHYLDLFVPADDQQLKATSDGPSDTETNLSVELTNTASECRVKHDDRLVPTVPNKTDYAEKTVFKDTMLSKETIFALQNTYAINNDNNDMDNEEIYTEDIADPTIQLVNKCNSGGYSAKSPLVIFVHGGGWRRGGREAWTHYLYFDVNFLLVILSLLVGTYKNVGQALASNGIACAVISYPLTEAGLLCLLAEVCLSYIQSCLAVTIATLPVISLLCFEFGFLWSHKSSFWTQINPTSGNIISTLILMIMLITNCITTFLLTVKKDKYKLRSNHIMYLWMTLIAGASVIGYAKEYKLLTAVIFTLFVNQGIILKLRLSRWGGSYEDQTEVLACAVKWAKTAGRRTGLFDTSKIYLMGHSAGGHLVSLTALDDDILARVGCSSNDITGVVSLSGVYDLLCLRGPFLRPFYLLPTFGHSHSTWIRASPSHVIRSKDTKDDKTRPKFLLIVAENDLFLKEQSIQFSQILQEAEVDCRHIEVIGTNHFTIVTSLVKRFTGNDKSVLHHIMHFIHH